MDWLFLFLLAALIGGSFAKLSRGRFAGLCAGCVVLAFAVTVVQYIPVYHEHQRILARFPVVDIKPRLSYEQTVLPAVQIVTKNQPGAKAAVAAEAAPAYQASQLDKLQERFSNHRWRSWDDARSLRSVQALSELHHGFVADFIAQPNVFGYGRMPTTKLIREMDVRPEASEQMSQPPPPIPQPKESVPTSGSPPEVPGGELQADLPVEPNPLAAASIQSKLFTEDFLSEQNRENVANFASPFSLGAVNSQREVRGFQSHAFREQPGGLRPKGMEETWKLQRLELISLLKHVPPAVYVSEHLPAMEELAEARTRPTNAFESEAIAKLRRGEEIVTDAKPDQLRMVGAIRAVAECKKCHQVQLGSLLGAFSYRFQSSQPPAAPNRAKLAKPLAQQFGRLVDLGGAG